MEYAIGYMVSIFVLQAIATVRTPYQDCRVVIVASMFWPLFLLLVLGSLLLDTVGWSFDMVKGAKLFGFRQSPNPNVRGYALTLFKIELQLFKVKA